MHSLRFKLILPFVLGTVALTTILALYTYSSARREVEEAMLSTSEARTTQVINSLSLLFRSMSTSLHNMVVDPHVLNLFIVHESPLPPGSHGATSDPALRRQTTEWIEIVARSNDYYRDIYILDKRGVCLVSSNPGHVGKSLAGQEVVDSALAGHFTIGNYSIGRVTKKFSASVAGPIDTGDHVGGALVVINDFPGIVEYAQRDQTDRQIISTALLTPEGMFAAHGDRELMGNKNKLFPELYKQLATIREQGGPVTYTLNGVTWVGYARLEPTTRWVVVTSGKQHEVLASAYRMGLTVTGISVFFLCIITFVVVRFAADILNSMFSLIGYAKAVSEGDLDLRLGATQRKDELGVLHTSLQRLVETLNSILLETKKASEMKGQFLANMSHEIRTPLNAIIGMTHLMLREDNLSDRLRLFIEKVQISSRLLFGLINDILDLSKVEAGMIEIERTPFDLHELLAHAVSIHQERADSANIKLILDIHAQVPRRMLGDPLRIGQILNNLLSNALKFTQAGCVRLYCEREHADPTAVPAAEGAQPVRIVFGVSDTGCGISPEAMGKLFQPFTQADASITRKFGGTGLGLTISKQLVELMGGTLRMDSTPDTGTTVTFAIGLEQLEDAPNELPVERGGTVCDMPLCVGRRILVVEDNAINQLIMEELLAPTGADILIANNGQEAVDRVCNEHIDLVFMDVQMPVLDGLEATQIIRANLGSTVLPIIALTAHAMKEDKRRCLLSGMNAYITKPVDPLVLASILREWMPPPA